MSPRFSALAALFGALMSACAEQTPSAPTLLFTAIPDDNTTELQQKFQPVAQYLSEELGVPVAYVPTSSYLATVEAFKNGDIHLAWFGGLTGVQARTAVEGATAIAQGVIDPQYKSFFITHRDSGLQPGPEFPSKLSEASFTFGSASSTSGRLMPEYFIREATGQSPEEFFSAAMSFSGSHDKTALLVQSGAMDAGVLSYKTYEKMVASGAIDPDVCQILWTTPFYPDYNWTAHPILNTLFGKGMIEKTQDALLNMKDPQLLAAILREEGLMEATNDDFEPIRALAQKLGFLD